MLFTSGFSEKNNLIPINYVKLNIYITDNFHTSLSLKPQPRNILFFWFVSFVDVVVVIFANCLIFKFIPQF